MVTGDTDVLTEMSEAAEGGNGRNPPWPLDGVSNITAKRESPNQKYLQLMEAVVERGNMLLALNRVKRNRGTSGVDGMSLSDLGPFLKDEWLQIREELLSGQYQPQPVRKVEIPKPGGGMRMLGIPTVLDRLIQQALHQVMQPIFDKDFSVSSYGFRPNRSVHQAVR
jgi:RNA-directed DNA polymerase